MTPKEHELDFWKGFVKTDRFLKGWVADVPTPELHDAVKYFFWFFHKTGDRILDLGSGVVSILNGLLPDFNLTTCDLLADDYKGIFAYGKNNRIPPPLPIAGEDIAPYYFQYDFDFVHISNALDHCTDPQKVFHNMVSVLKRGGYVIVQGFENEADHEKFQGMHQHNLMVEGNLLLPIDTSRVTFFKSFRFQNHYQGRTWFVWIGQKLQ